MPNNDRKETYILEPNDFLLFTAHCSKQKRLFRFVLNNSTVDTHCIVRFICATVPNIHKHMHLQLVYVMHSIHAAVPVRDIGIWHKQCHLVLKCPRRRYNAELNAHTHYTFNSVEIESWSTRQPMLLDNKRILYFPSYSLQYLYDSASD